MTWIDELQLTRSFEAERGYLAGIRAELETPLMLLEERSVGNEAVHAWEIAIGHMSGFLELLIDAEGLSYRIEAAVTAALAAEQEIAAEDAEEEEDDEEEDDEEDEDEDDDEDLL